MVSSLIGRLLLVTAVLTSAAAASSEPPTAHAIPLLPSTGGRVSMDYLGYDEATDTVWAPGGNTGKVFVIDARTEQVRSSDGFPVLERDGRVIGTSSVTFAPGVAYIGNRADASVCAVSTSTLKRGACTTIASMPDGLAYVAGTSEVWVTTPRDHSVTVLGAAASGLTGRGKIVLDGEPEGYAVDSKRGLFFTNLEDKDQTLAIDVSTRGVKARWKTGCGAKGPRGLALDSEHGLLFVACTSRVLALAVDRDGMQVGDVATGDGVDNPAIAPGLKRVFAAAGAAGTLSRLEYALDGGLRLLDAPVTANGVRVVVTDKRGKAFAADSAGGRIWVVGP
jgi:hypothetical protein